ncbi:MAG: hypothetical protein MRY32_04430 [Rickettsiales bacterium]|nr:hypothetical protein [Rickettsiales bacterium]
MSNSPDHSLRMMTPKRKRKRREHGSSLEDILLGEPYFGARREQAVWRAVILQMVTDALSGSRKKENQRYKREALAWLNGKSRDFRTVCELAGYEPSYVLQQIEQTVGEQLRNARKTIELCGPKPPIAPVTPSSTPAASTVASHAQAATSRFSQPYVMPGQHAASFSLSIPSARARWQSSPSASSTKEEESSV